ncbi:MAG: hypothetical protein IJ282_02810 [Lachnospiraceae bacterium]|nr:hypothetical protein [Lachnospiraceae bacterium]
MGKGRINYLKWIKLSIAAPLSMIIAGVLGLNYATSAATITLLTVQDTKKDTLEISIKRILAFAVMTGLCFLLFPLIGYNVLAYAAFLCIFLLLCYIAGLESGITMNAVLAGHYLGVGEMSLAAVGNEAAILFIGAGMGILANLIMPENLQKIRKDQRQIDGAMKRILERMSVYLCQEDRSDYTGECFEQVDKLLESMEREAKLRIRNTFTKGDTYFISYMQMRMRQCEVLKSVYGSIMQLTVIPMQAEILSRFLKEVSDSFHETNNAERLLESLAQMRSGFKISDLPKSREEFENRAVLMQIAKDLEQFLKIKSKFVAQLSKEEQQKYWTDNEQ